MRNVFTVVYVIVYTVNVFKLEVIQFAHMLLLFEILSVEFVKKKKKNVHYNNTISFFSYYMTIPYFYSLYLSKYPCDQAVIPPEIPGGDGGSKEGSISCGDETKQTAYVPFA